MNIPIPDWCTDEIYKKFQDIVKIEYEIRSYTPFLRRLNGGALIKRFIDNIKVNEERDRPRKIYLYSGHEVNIAAVARALNLNEPELPPYGCAIIIEKLRDQHGKAYIRVIIHDKRTILLKLISLIRYDNASTVAICDLDGWIKIGRN